MNLCTLSIWHFCAEACWFFDQFKDSDRSVETNPETTDTNKINISHNNQYLIKVQHEQINDCCRGVRGHSHMQILAHWHVRKIQAWFTCRLCSFAPDLRSTSLKAPSSSRRDWLSPSPFCSWRQWDTRSSASLLLACSRFRCCYKKHIDKKATCQMTTKIAFLQQIEDIISNI